MVFISRKRWRASSLARSLSVDKRSSWKYKSRWHQVRERRRSSVRQASPSSPYENWSYENWSKLRQVSAAVKDTSTIARAPPPLPPPSLPVAPRRSPCYSPALQLLQRDVQERANPIEGRIDAGITRWICLHTRGCAFSCGCAPHHAAR